MVCQKCGKTGHIERFCPNVWRMGFINRNEKRRIKMSDWKSDLASIYSEKKKIIIMMREIENY